jgi:hypothetical protein
LIILRNPYANTSFLAVIMPGEFAPGFLQPGESLTYQLVLTEEEIANRSVTLGIFTSDKEYLEEG